MSGIPRRSALSLQGMTNRLIRLCMISILGLSACGGGIKPTEGSARPSVQEPGAQLLFQPDPQGGGGPFEDLFPGNPKVSPNGRLVAFLGGIGNRVALGVIGPEGHATVVTGADAYLHSFAWMPGSDSLLAASVSTAGSDPFSANDFGIWSNDGELVRTISSSVGLSVEEGMTVAADGAVAIVAGTPPPDEAGFGLQADLYLVDLTTGKVEQLTQTPLEDERDPEFVGKDRVFFVKSKGRDEWGRGYVLDLQSRQLQAVTPADEPVVDATAEGTSDLVVYSTARPGSLIGNEPCFRSISLDGSQRRELFCRDARYPDLAPDGTWLVVEDIGPLVPPTDPRQIVSAGSLIRITLSGS
jgi:hypothetical protein